MEGKSEPIISCIDFVCVKHIVYLILKTRRVKVKRDSSAKFKTLPSRIGFFAQLNSAGMGRKIQKHVHVHDSVADKELAVDHKKDNRKSTKQLE